MGISLRAVKRGFLDLPLVIRRASALVRIVCPLRPTAPQTPTSHPYTPSSDRRGEKEMASERKDVGILAVDIYIPPACVQQVRRRKPHHCFPRPSPTCFRSRFRGEISAFLWMISCVHYKI